MKNLKNKIGFIILAMILPLALYAGPTPDTKGTDINGNWAALTNTAKIADRQYWLYLSVDDGQACLHTLYVKGNTCPSKCYPVTKGAFEADKIAYAFTLNAKDQVLVESWTVANKADGLGWVKYNLPAGCSHKKK